MECLDFVAVNENGEIETVNEILDDSFVVVSVDCEGNVLLEL